LRRGSVQTMRHCCLGASLNTKLASSLGSRRNECRACNWTDGIFWPASELARHALLAEKLLGRGHHRPVDEVDVGPPALFCSHHHGAIGCPGVPSYRPMIIACRCVALLSVRLATGKMGEHEEHLAASSWDRAWLDHVGLAMAMRAELSNIDERASIAGAGSAGVFLAIVMSHRRRRADVLAAEDGSKTESMWWRRVGLVLDECCRRPAGIREPRWRRRRARPPPARAT
jgi:hypothetical protein